jgi:hypothetical protein
MGARMTRTFGHGFSRGLGRALNTDFVVNSFSI